MVLMEMAKSMIHRFGLKKSKVGANLLDCWTYSLEFHAFQKAWADFCQASEAMPTLEIEGTIGAPNSFDSWDGDGDYEKRIGFTASVGLIVDGGGRFDGRGEAWWKACNPQGHISINACDDVEVSNLQILAPDENPNTDGIDISESNHELINGFSTCINVTGVKCGPGHGTSIGSLGKDGAYETVEEGTAISASPTVPCLSSWR
ncbi:hypothetical protein Peur_072737 [Populus x canadensis]